MVRGPGSPRLHTCASIRGDCRVPFTADSVIEFRTRGENVDRMTDCVRPGTELLELDLSGTTK